MSYITIESKNRIYKIPVIWSKDDILFMVFVILDVFTTVLLIDNPYLYESNPIVNYIFTQTNLSIGMFIFYFIKVVALYLIMCIITYQKRYSKKLSEVTYYLILTMCVHVVMNNIFLLLTH